MVAQAEKKYPCIESMTKVKVGLNYTARVWRDEPHVLDVYDNRDVYAAADEMEQGRRRQAEIAHHLAALPRVNTVEVLDQTGCGVVVYTH